MVPSALSASANDPPLAGGADCATMLDRTPTPPGPFTCTGIGWLMVLPMPSWPLLLLPQPQTVPSAFSASVKFPPAVSDTTPDPRPTTGTGILLAPTTAGLPRLPLLLLPQLHTLPSALSATAWERPAAIATTPEPLPNVAEAAGVRRLVNVPSPS